MWTDNNANQLYDPGEGIGGVTIRLAGGNYYAATAENGGYAIPFEENGHYIVTFSRPGFNDIMRTVTMLDGWMLVDVVDWQ